MEKDLILKILGKKNAVSLNDEIFNLIEMTQDLRTHIILNQELDDAYIGNKLLHLKTTYDAIIIIKNDLENSNISSYTNSKNYLDKFISDISITLEKVIKHLKPFDRKEFTYNLNLLIDLILKY